MVIKKSEVKSHLPLNYKLNDKEYEGKVISCMLDTSNQVYILELKNKVESYCIKASKTWEIDSVITALPPIY